MSALKSVSMRSFVKQLFKRIENAECLHSQKRWKSNSVLQDVESIHKIPLSQPVPGLPVPIYANVSSCENPGTKVTTLPNGLRVASESKFGQFCTVGVIIDSGSRYEVLHPIGISHFLERIAFNSTVGYADREAIMSELEKHGGICDCQSSRDTLIYATSANSKGLDSVVRMLSEVVLRPKLLSNEIADVQTMIGFELQDMATKPDQEALLTEMIHAAAYYGNTLGLPKFCTAENIMKMNQEALFTYMKNYHIPERMVVAGVGVEHDALVESAQKHFFENKAIWESNPNLCSKTQPPVDNSISQYTGGNNQVEKDLSNISMGPTPIPNLVHFALGFESSSHQDPDFVAFCVLNMMMGGGGSFSAGGPGKGMFTRLYTNVLNRHHWMYNATAYNHAYNDSGIFCIHASSNPAQLKDLVEVIVREFINTASSVEKSELDRAKTQLQSMLLMNLESRPVVFEDIARQVLATGHRKPPQYFIEEIEKITAEDIQRVASRMLRTKPSVAALGDLRKLPSVSDIEYSLGAKDGKLPRKFSLFR